jgi:hypothetical protein
MLARVHSATVFGIEADDVFVEVDWRPACRPSPRWASENRRDHLKRKAEEK